MPLDLIPLIFLGLRFARTTTFLPYIHTTVRPAYSRVKIMATLSKIPKKIVRA